MSSVSNVAPAPAGQGPASSSSLANANLIPAPAPTMPQTGVPTSSVAQGNEDEVQPTRLNMNEKVVAAFSRIEPEFLGFTKKL